MYISPAQMPAALIVTRTSFGASVGVGQSPTCIVWGASKMAAFIGEDLLIANFPNVSWLHHNNLRHAVATLLCRSQMFVELSDFVAIWVDVVAGQYVFQSEPLSRQCAFARAHLGCEHPARHGPTVQNFHRVR